MKQKREYDADSLERGLIHHETGGRIVSYVRLAPTERKRWIVACDDSHTISMTDSECSALCYGLASAERAYNAGRAVAKVVS